MKKIIISIAMVATLIVGINAASATQVTEDTKISTKLVHNPAPMLISKAIVQ